ncbi:MAG TPA: hypothetical protein VGG62_16215 [Terracidiphilus sp.]
MPVVTDIIRGAMGSMRKAIQVLRFSADPAVVSFFETYDTIPQGDREYLPIEAIAFKASVSPVALLGAILLASKTVRGQQSALMAINAHPALLKKTIKYAGMPEGSKDRQMLHQAVGFLPSPHQGGVNMNVNLLGPPQYPQGIAAPEAAPVTEEEISFESLFPSVKLNLEEWSEDRQRLLADKT